MTWKFTAIWCAATTGAMIVMLLLFSFASWENPADMIDWSCAARYVLGLHVIAFTSCAVWKLVEAAKRRRSS